MTKFKIGQAWFDDLVPEGLPIPSSTLISGEGGSGKPLLGFSVLSSWLKQGGESIFILTSTGKDFVEESMKKIYGMEIADYNKNLAFVEFNPSLAPAVNAVEESGDTIKANLVNPEVWDKAIEIADARLKQGTQLGTLVFCSAINLFLFSKTYKKAILNRLRELIKEDKTKTYLFTVSTSAYKEEISTLESVADNLMFTRVEQPMKLFLKVTKMKDVSFSNKEIGVPLNREDLLTIKNLSEDSRKDLIPTIVRI
jgi:KaiC/GvpD/RAD55 family RecA-like ATPase